MGEFATLGQQDCISPSGILRMGQRDVDARQCVNT